MTLLLFSFLLCAETQAMDPGFISAEELYQATAIQVDSKGKIFVVDAGNHRVLCFDHSGKRLFEFGRQGQGPGEFVEPTDIGFLEGGRLLVGDGGNRRVQIFDEMGIYISMIKIPDQPVGKLLVLPNDTFVLTRMAGSTVHLDLGETKPNRFQTYDLQGKKTGSFGEYTSHENPLLEAMLNNGAVDVLGNKVVFAGINTNELIIYDGQHQQNHVYPLSFVPKEPQAKMEQEKLADGSISFQMAVEADQLCSAMVVMSENELLLLRKTKAAKSRDDEVDDQLIRIDTKGNLKKTYEGVFRAKAMAVSPDAKYGYIIHELEEDVLVARIML